MRTRSLLIACTVSFGPAVLCACSKGSKASTSGAGAAQSTSAATTATGSSSSSGVGGGFITGSVLQRNKHASRDGLYVEPALTPAAAASMHLDTSFAVTMQGNVYAQPLYVENGPNGKGTFYAATESDNIYALSEADGSIVWQRSLGTPAGVSGAGCGNVAPIGVTGTPVIDLPSRTMYVDAAIGDATTIQHHMVHALSIDDGSERAGFPFDTTGVAAGGQVFNPVVQNQRGSLLFVNGTLYVPFGGHGGDCGEYRGWVIGIPVANPSGVNAFVTQARGGGIWAAGGPSSDGTDVFASTGNTFGGNTFSFGETVVRLTAGAAFSGATTDYFAPSNWKPLDDADADLGGSGPLVVDVPGATPSKLVVALGKNGVVYLLDRSDLGGIGTGDGTTGEGVASAKVANAEIINAAASFTSAQGTFVILHVYMSGPGANCPPGQSGDLVGLKISASSPPTISTAWCADNLGQGSPIVTMTDATSNPIVWTTGAEGSQRLHGFNAETGAIVFDGGGATDLMTQQVRRFNSPIVVNGRIIVGADNTLYAFKTP